MDGGRAGFISSSFLPLFFDFFGLDPLRFILLYLF